MDDPKAFSFDSLASNSMKSSNPNSGCREVDVAKTLDTGSVSPEKNQGGIAIVQPTMILNDQGGSQMGISYDVTSTLRAEDHQHPPLVMREAENTTPAFSAGFKPRQSAQARTLGYEEEMAPTINTDENYAVIHSDAVPIENHPNDSRVKLAEDGVVQTLSGRMGTGGNNTPLVMERRFSDVRISENDVSPTLESGTGEGGNNLPMVLNAIPFDTTQITSPNNWSHPKPDDPCHPLASTAHPPAVAYGLDQQGGKGGANYSEEVCPPILSDSHGTPHAIAFTQNQREEVRDLDDTVPTCIGNGQGDIASHISEEMSQTLNCMHDPMAVMTAVDCRNGTENEEVNGTLQAKEQGQNLNSNNVARTGNTVRRLTPLECERLQSFPDNWTNIGDWVDSKGKLHKGDADTPRYKALGNSIALPFWDWLLGRISAQYDRPATLGSLFDGIGGFALCWEHHNGKGTAVWASEVEEFCIAVTKLRFPEDDDGDPQD